jgi:hypothetical protein
MKRIIKRKKKTEKKNTRPFRGPRLPRSSATEEEFLAEATHSIPQLSPPDYESMHTGTCQSTT